MKIQEVIDKEKVWKCSVLSLIRAYKQGTKFTANDIRATAVVKKLPPPPSSPNAWGAAFRAAAKMQLIARTGRCLPSAVPTSHGSIVLEWVRL